MPEPEEVPKKPKSRDENLPKPEEVPKKTKKTKVPEVLGPGDLQNFVFFGFFGTSSGFGKIFTSRFWFFGTSSGFGNIFLKTLPKPEEVSTKNKILQTFFLGVFLVPPQVLERFSPLDFGFFGTSSGSGNMFPENLVKT